MISGSVQAYGIGPTGTSAKATTGAASRAVPVYSFERLLEDRTRSQLSVAAGEGPAPESGKQAHGGELICPASNVGLLARDVMADAGAIIPDEALSFDAPDQFDLLGLAASGDANIIHRADRTVFTGLPCTCGDEGVTQLAVFGHEGRLHKERSLHAALVDQNGTVPAGLPWAASADANTRARIATADNFDPLRSVGQICQDSTGSQCASTAEQAPAVEDSGEVGGVVPLSPASNGGQLVPGLSDLAKSIVPAYVFRFEALGLLHTRELAACPALTISSAVETVPLVQTSHARSAPAGKDEFSVADASPRVGNLGYEEGSRQAQRLEAAEVLSDLSTELRSLSRQTSVSANSTWESMGSVLARLQPSPVGTRLQPLPEPPSGILRSHARAARPIAANRSTQPFLTGARTYQSVSVTIDTAQAPSVAIGIVGSAESDGSLVSQVRQLLARYGLVASKIVVAGREAQSDEQMRGEDIWL